MKSGIGGSSGCGDVAAPAVEDALCRLTRRMETALAKWVALNPSYISERSVAEPIILPEYFIEEDV